MLDFKKKSFFGQWEAGRNEGTTGTMLPLPYSKTWFIIEEGSSYPPQAVITLSVIWGRGADVYSSLQKKIAGWLSERPLVAAY
jgi:hypothetical protein